MDEFINKLIERLEEELKLADEVKEKCARENPLMFDNAKGYSTGIANAKSFVNQLAEDINVGGNNGWIPVSSGRLPEDREAMLVCATGSDEGVFISYYVEELKAWRYDTEEGIHYYVEVIAWQPLPATYQPKGE